MGHGARRSSFSDGDQVRLMVYVADLELEVDRLRRQGQFIQEGLRSTLKQLRQSCKDADQQSPTPRVPEGVMQAADDLQALLQDFREPPGYHPAHDQVATIALRPLLEQVFRWQQRLTDARATVLQLELDNEYLEWFPARLRHILDNLLSNALQARDLDKTDGWVRITLHTTSDRYEITILDNGIGMPLAAIPEAFEFFYRAAPLRTTGMRSSLAIVKLLVEQSGGSMTVESKAEQGSTFTVVLPRYDRDDYLT